ncbi:hypothetical protein CS063_02570 [Sporanaerobium hydrogeniformans]|uniref:Uncharacterized protein n=1 Tax=Sporanaerobium hydrogeniformans TaxID=3072179 RepID=A0AC61DI22_9FIRM|nr:endonuclease MutS2 [Sporanaerobium hydrogeniformans]PHV72380.1 hypothetical protein CS063_02570 [Sporanaerobium hydrogeniformans]
MNVKSLYKLEFPKVKALVTHFALTEGGKEICEKMEPQVHFEVVDRLQRETADALAMSVKKGRLPLGSLKQVAAIIKRVEIGAILSSTEVLNVGSVLKASRTVKNYQREGDQKEIPYPAIDDYFEAITTHAQVEKEIERCIVGPDQFSDEATPELYQIRRQMKQLQNKIKEALQGIIYSTRYQDMLQDPVITIRRERYCIPIKVEYKTQFKGIVHDQSATGATVFMEPMTVVELNNELKSLEAKEQEEIEKILIDLTTQIQGIAPYVLTNYTQLVKLDAIFARAEFSLKYNCRQPRLNTEGRVKLKKARHPLLQVEQVVPIDVEVGDTFSTLLITGPNTGGKTVTLKTVGLFAVMTACGLQIPAGEGSEMAIFDEIYADLGDEQSIEQSLSTFSAHMTNIVSILQNVTPQSLVLLDEVGSGTDPIEGAALAMSILENLRKGKIRTVATTHYSELKLYALSTEGVENASCEFDVESLRPTYRLLTGIPGKSNAFAISMRLGLPSYIIERAKTYLEKENVNMESILVDLEESKKLAELESERAKEYRAEAERLKEEIAKERKKIDHARKKILEKAEIKAKEMLKAAELETDKALKEVRAAARKAQVLIDEKDLQAAKQGMSETIEGQNKKINKITGRNQKNTPKLKTVAVGEEVLVASLMQQGTVIEAPDSNGNVVVRLGIMPMKIHISQLERISEPKEEVTKSKSKNKMPKSAGGVSYNLSKTSTISTQVDVRGMMVDEALPIVDKYLDDAYLSGLKQVTIIHGKGTGALRAAVNTMLRRHPHVEGYRPGKYGEGEMGVTVVTIK